MGGMVSSKLVANWFERQRGRAFGIATVGISLSGLLMPTAATWLIAELGWRGAFLVYAFATAAVVIPLVARFVVNRPEDLGLRPDGERSEADGGPPLPAADPAWRSRQILASRNFWAIALCFALAFGTLSAVLTHLVPHADDLGIPPYRAAWLLSFAAGAGILGKLVFGRLFDRLDPRVAIWCSLGTQLGGVLWLLRGDSFAELVPASLLFGFGMGGTVPLQAAVTGAAFGRISFGKAMGLLRPVQMPIHVLGIPLAGWIYDVSGSYDTAFRVFVASYLAACLAVLALRVRPARSAFTPPAEIPEPPC
jgi:MFS family permease